MSRHESPPTPAAEGPRAGHGAARALDWLGAALEDLERDDLLRHIPAPLQRQLPRWTAPDGPRINLASNDYLGLAADPRLVEAAIAAARAEGVGRGASPLICGRSPSQALLERRLADFEGAEAALLFPSGFAANAGVIPALVDAPDAIYADTKNHASLIDGCRLARAQTFVYPHADMAALNALLEAGGSFRRRLIVTDTVFSMDGDVAPLAPLAELADRYEAMLLVDEAHATGVLGPHGRGAVEQCAAEQPPGAPPLEERVAIRIGTLSKALGSSGGFVCGSRLLIDWLANRARSYVFSTSAVGMAAAAAIAALDIVEHDPLPRRRVLALASQVRDQLRQAGWDVGGSTTQIIPLRVATPAAALELAARLRERGLWAPAIRPPSVPAGESLVRLSLRADLTDEEIGRLLDALATIGPPRT
jgi:8-amino-7-oxononanoate synthase